MQQIIKAKTRDLIASVLSLSGLTSFSRLPSSSLTILTFHRVLPTELRALYPLPGLAVTPEELHWVLSIVRKYFDINTLSVAYNNTQLANCQKPQLAITFDDGQWDNLEYGIPVLNELDIPATFYIPTAYIGGKQLLWHDEAAFTWQQLANKREDVFTSIQTSCLPEQIFTSVTRFLEYLKQLSASERNHFINQLKLVEISVPEWSRLMDWNEINYLHAHRHEIGSHARTHNLLSQLSTEEQYQELNESMLDIKDATGKLPLSFCYPDGKYNKETLRLLYNSQYETAVTTNWGNNRTISDSFQLRRFDIGSEHLHNHAGVLSNPRFQFRLSNYHPKI